MDVDSRVWVVLVEIFEMSPKIQKYVVRIGRDLGYGRGGQISLPADDLINNQLKYDFPRNLRGALVHEMSRGPLEPLIHDHEGKNPLDEPFAVLLQIATYERLAEKAKEHRRIREADELREHARFYRAGHDVCDDQHPLLFVLLEILDTHGIQPLRGFFQEIEDHDESIIGDGGTLQRYEDYCFHLSKHANANLSPILRSRGFKISRDVETKIKNLLRSIDYTRRG